MNRIQHLEVEAQQLKSEIDKMVLDFKERWHLNLFLYNAGGEGSKPFMEIDYLAWESLVDNGIAATSTGNNSELISNGK